ncbi:transglutaminase-like cysteine proteinase BTLCP [Sphingobium faniae]|nr:transglutaminase-like cysteine proteinase BTLCP [Sphingobium faniae]
MAQGLAATSRITAIDSVRSGVADSYRDALVNRRLSQDLFGGSNRLMEISARQMDEPHANGQAHAVHPAASPIINNQRITDIIGQLPALRIQGMAIMFRASDDHFRVPVAVPAYMQGLTAATTPILPAAVPQASPFIISPRPAPALLSSTGLSGKPDIFGSVALPLRQSSLDAKWASANRALPQSGKWSAIVQSSRHADRQKQAEIINIWVNRQLRFTDDRPGADHWATAAQSLQQGRGDCEDYAIAKMKLLEAAGFHPRSMFLVIVKDLVRRADHAVLAVQIDGELMVLDNMTDRILPSSQISDYRPVLSFNAFGRWTHGYRVTPPRATQFAAR